MPDRICNIAGCEKKVIARGLCATHYQRMKNGKIAEAQMMRENPPIEPQRPKWTYEGREHELISAVQEQE